MEKQNKTEKIDQIVKEYRAIIDRTGNEYGTAEDCHEASRAFLRSLSSYERNMLQHILFKDMCSKELANIPYNIKENCFVCGKKLKKVGPAPKTDEKRYIRRGNACEECFMESTRRGDRRIKIENIKLELEKLQASVI